jgi:uncharacterized membrane protein YfcA
LISMGGVLGHLKAANLNWLLTGFVLFGSLLGMFMGSQVVRTIPAHHLRRGVALLIGAIGLLLIVANGWHFLG